MPTDTLVQTLAETLAPWHDFHALIGTAAATLVALLFVAASVGGGVFTGQAAPLRVFLSASVVAFSVVLALSLIALAPVPGWHWFGGLVLCAGTFGLFHAGLAWRSSLRDGLIARIDLEDRTWYLALPFAGYLCVAASGVALALGAASGCTTLALSMGVLLIIGIHNAWDITVWIITRRRD